MQRKELLTPGQERAVLDDSPSFQLGIDGRRAKNAAVAAVRIAAAAAGAE
jgi:hypothetical protein